MTNQQGAPEARSYEHQRAIMEGERNASLDAYSRVVYLTQTESRIYETGFTNGWNRLAALVEAQQPATHVQNPAEIEHVVGDVSKNSPESNMAQQPAPSDRTVSHAAQRVPGVEWQCGPQASGFGQQPAPSGQQPFGWIKQSEIDSSNDFGGSINLWRQKYDCDVPVYLAQQPAPSAAAVEHGDGFMEAINEMDELHPFQAAPQPSPTPQADSQPAPLNAWQQAIDHELVIANLGVAGAATFEEARKAIQELIAWHVEVATDPATNGGKVLVDAASAPADSVTEPALGLQNLHNLLYLAQRQTSKAAMERVVSQARLELARMRDASPHAESVKAASTGELLMGLAVIRELTGTQKNDLESTVDAVRSAFAPKPARAHSVTAPAGGGVAGWQMVPIKPTHDMLCALSGEWHPSRHQPERYAAMLAAAPTPPAQAAPSALEDADPLQGAANWLAEAHGQFGVAVLQGCLMIGYNRAKRLHDAAIAARKQGGA